MEAGGGPAPSLLIHLQFLLVSEHREGVFAERLFAVRADIKAFVIAVMQLTYLIVQVADATTRCIRLARHLAIMLEKFMQRLEHLTKVEAAARAPLRRFYDRKSACRMTCTHLAPIDKRMTIPRRSLYILIAQSRLLHICIIVNIFLIILLDIRLRKCKTWRARRCEPSQMDEINLLETDLYILICF